MARAHYRQSRKQTLSTTIDGTVHNIAPDLAAPVSMSVTNERKPTGVEVTDPSDVGRENDPRSLRRTSSARPGVIHAYPRRHKAPCKSLATGTSPVGLARGAYPPRAFNS